MPAKATATLDRLTVFRVRLGPGAGAFWEAIAAMSGPRREPEAAVDALDEAITVVRAMWSGERSVRTPGAHYSLAGVHPGPAPNPGPGI
ncbi:LLM class flavin-dependent oxidoreductase [Streptomyces sp. NPDC001978]|uniref:LLM class flavin-dependent oxidoreductase n=1 Tax=Streptomyces sp. NPDC001978 TaxID=3364627 RepID=UPI00368FC06D